MPPVDISCPPQRAALSNVPEYDKYPNIDSLKPILENTLIEFFMHDDILSHGPAEQILCETCPRTLPCLADDREEQTPSHTQPAIMTRKRINHS